MSIIKNEDNRENEGETDFPDGGWGWVVCFGSFMIHVIADGMAYSFGVYVEEFVVYFDCGRGSIGMLGSLMLGVTWCTGPIASILTNKFGCKLVTIAGTLIAASGFIISLFAPNIYFMYFSFGFIAGFGLGMAYLPAIVAVSFWFEKKRSLATGLAVCGSGVGTFIFAPLTDVLLLQYGWQGTVLIESGILLNCIVCGMLFRPVDRHPKLKPATQTDAIATPLISPKQSKDLEEALLTTSMPDIHKSHSKADNSIRKRFLSESSQQQTGNLDNQRIRKDAFYPSNLTNIPLYNKDRTAYTKSMTSVTQLNNLPQQQIEKQPACCKCVPSGAQGQCKEMFDVSLLLDFVFLLFCVSNLLTSIGFCVPYIFLPDRAARMPWAAHESDEAVIKSKSSLLISIVGISNTIGRIVFGWLADRKFVNRLMLYNTVLVLCGAISIMSALCLTYPLMATYAALFGLFIGVYVCLTPVVLVDLLGLAKLSNAFGVVLWFQGVGAIIGPPIAGYVYDTTLDYDNSFYLMGVCILVSGLMLYPIPCIRRHCAQLDSPQDIALGKLPSNITHLPQSDTLELNV